MTINKEDFEKALPVGVSAHDEVFEAVSPECALQEELYNMSLLGDEGVKIITEAGDDSFIVSQYKRLVCISAFLAVFRQLDLVLTPTGFGVVSNENVSPASKQRVDALEGQLRTVQCKALAVLVNLLRSESWGKSQQALNCIRHLYTGYSFFSNAKSAAVTYQDWQNIQPAIEDADEFLRTRISDELMDDLLEIFRHGKEGGSLQTAKLVSMIQTFTDVWSRKGVDAARQPVFRRLMRIVEDNPEDFELYFNSNAYKRNHHETFQNTKDSTAFVFGC